MEKNNAQFIKVGDRLLPKQKGMDYDLISGQLYDLSYDRYMGEVIFKENGELNLPKKIYESETDKMFKYRVFKQFNKPDSKDVNILLNGTKGTGKTMMAKIIARESKLPIIIVAPDFPEQKLIEFFKKFNTPVCIIFDEIEKNFNTERMLDFLDGVEKTTKKLVIMTCNDMDNLSEFLKDRCSRIRYLRNYTIKDNYEFIPMIAEDLGLKDPTKVANFCKSHIKLPSIDNVNAFLNEVKMFEDDNIDMPLIDIIKYMNIELRKDCEDMEEEQPKKLQEPEVVSDEKKKSYNESTESSTLPLIESIDLDWNDDEEDYDDDIDNPLYDEAA